jgi:hypothetical protein
MAYSKVLQNPPKRITASESLSWSVAFFGFPASDGWALVYTLVKSGNSFAIIASADGSKFLVEIPHTTTKDYVTGKYNYQAHVSKGDERYLVESGVIEVITDFATAVDGVDARPWIDRCIDELEARIENRAGKTQTFQTISGVQIQHMTLEAQLDALGRLKRIKAARSGKPFKSINSRFRA